jgi:DNA-binding response OmpR family regulator
MANYQTASSLAILTGRSGRGASNQVGRDGPVSVLVIDDEPAMRALVNRTLSIPGHRVIDAGGGDAGPQLAADPTVQLAILDLVLNEQDGFKVLTVLRKRHPTLPVLVLVHGSRLSARSG